MSHVTDGGAPLNWRTPAPNDPNVTSPNDRRFMELLRAGEFAEAKRAFPDLFTSAHLGFLCQETGYPAPSDDEGLIPPLTPAQLTATLDYLEGPMKA